MKNVFNVITATVPVLNIVVQYFKSYFKNLSVFKVSFSFLLVSQGWS